MRHLIYKKGVAICFYDNLFSDCTHLKNNQLTNAIHKSGAQQTGFHTVLRKKVMANGIFAGYFISLHPYPQQVKVLR